MYYSGWLSVKSGPHAIIEPENGYMQWNRKHDSMRNRLTSLELKHSNQTVHYHSKREDPSLPYQIFSTWKSPSPSTTLPCKAQSFLLFVCLSRGRKKRERLRKISFKDVDFCRVFGSANIGFSPSFAFSLSPSEELQKKYGVDPNVDYLLHIDSYVEHNPGFFSISAMRLLNFILQSPPLQSNAKE